MKPMTTPQLTQWLRDNSAGIYRPAAEAADLIDQLTARNALLTRALEGMVWAAQMAGGWSEHEEAPLGIALDTLKRGREQACP